MSYFLSGFDLVQFFFFFSVFFYHFLTLLSPLVQAQSLQDQLLVLGPVVIPGWVFGLIITGLAWGKPVSSHG